MFHLLNYCASDLDLVQLSLDFITDDLISAYEYYIGVIFTRKVYTYTPLSQKYAQIWLLKVCIFFSRMSIWIV